MARKREDLSDKWFPIVDRINKIGYGRASEVITEEDMKKYNPEGKLTKRQVAKLLLEDLKAEKENMRDGFNQEREKKLIDDLKGMIGVDISDRLFDGLKYIEPLNSAYVSKRDHVAIDGIIKRKLSKSEVKKLEKQGFDVWTTQYCYSSYGVIRMSDNLANVSKASMVEGHEGTHKILEDSKLRDAWNGDYVNHGDVASIEETTADLVGETRAISLLKKKYGSDSDELKKYVDSIEKNMYMAKDLGKVRKTVEKMLLEKKLEEADSYMEKAEKELRTKYDIPEWSTFRVNRPYLAVNKMYSGNPEVRGSLEKIKELVGVRDMVEIVADCTSVAELKKAVESTKPRKPGYAGAMALVDGMQGTQYRQVM